MINSPKVAVVGWDSATWKVIFPLLEAGVLPNLGKLMKNGRCGTLLSTIHPVSPTAWSTFMTGMNPGKHGVFDFVGFNDLNQIQVVNGNALQAKTIWALLSEDQRKNLVMNVPMTYPPQPVNGFLVSGMDSPYHDRIYTHPPSLGKGIQKRFKDFVVEVPTKKKFWMSPEIFIQSYIDQLCRMTLAQSSIVCELLNQDSFDFVTIVFTAPDRIQHVLGDEMNRISPKDGIGRIYQTCDRAMGKILAQLDEQWNVFLISDHGAAPYKRVFELSTWLEQNNWLQLRPPQNQNRIEKTIYRILRQICKRFNYPLDRVADQQGYLTRIHWNNTKAFALGAFGSIYINSTQRFPDGIVSPAEYELILDILESSLLSIVDPETNQKVIKVVHRGKDLYHGPLTHLGPDLLIETTDDYFVRSNLDHLERRVFYPAGRYQTRSLPHLGKHTREGVLIASGPLISPDSTFGFADISDLAPTILNMFGLPIPVNMDGKPMLDWLSLDFTTHYPPVWSSKEDDNPEKLYQDSPKENTMLESRLRDLGYL